MSLSAVEKLSQMAKQEPLHLTGSLPVPVRGWKAVAYHLDTLWPLLTPDERKLVRGWKDHLRNSSVTRAVWDRFAELATRHQAQGTYESPFTDRAGLKHWVRDTARVRALKGVGADEKG
jgi:hypothetical protein